MRSRRPVGFHFIQAWPSHDAGGGFFFFRLRAPRRFLSGDLIENSPYHLFMEQDQFCKVLCQVDLTKSDVAALKTIIREEYHHNWIIDNLPAASIVDSEQYIITAYAGGFPVGYQDHKASYLFNHVNIIVEYHPLDDGSRALGFYVEPFTVKHKFANDAKWDGSGEAPPLSTCDKSGPMVYEAIAAKQDVQTGPVIFTYDVLWRASNVKWARGGTSTCRWTMDKVRSRRPAVIIDGLALHQTRSWLVSFSSLRPSDRVARRGTRRVHAQVHYSS